MRTSPDIIKQLPPNGIFVFGSNLSGIHGKGAAKKAFDDFGAIYGNPIGLQGKSYAIPTKNKNITKALNIKEISKYVDEFIEFAKENSDLDFYVTKIGCGLSGLTVKIVSPLFKRVIEESIYNVLLPKEFLQEIEKNLQKGLFN